MTKKSLLLAIASALALTGCVSTPDPNENTLRVIPNSVTIKNPKPYDTKTSYSRIKEEEKPYIRYIMNKYAVIAHETTPPNATPAPINFDLLADHSRQTILAVEKRKEAERIRRYQENLPPPPKEYDPNTYTLPSGFGQNNAYWSGPQQQQYSSNTTNGQPQAPQGQTQPQVAQSQAQSSGSQSNTNNDNNSAEKPVELAPQSEQFNSREAYASRNGEREVDSRPRVDRTLTPENLTNDDIGKNSREDEEMMRRIVEEEIRQSMQ